jgi:hypothetical protein
MMPQAMGYTKESTMHAAVDRGGRMLAQAAPPNPTFSGPETTWIVVIVVIALAIVLAIVWTRSQRSQALHRRFGPEYDRTVERSGSAQRAEAELAARERRIRALDIRPLPPDARQRYADAWRGVQARFVDAPGPATAEADRLVTNVMRDRGYPIGDETQRLEDLSVDHARVLDNYRVARAVSLKSERGVATTEELRSAMIAYRALFADLLGPDRVADGAANRG